MKGPRFEGEGADHRFLAGPFVMHLFGTRHPTDRAGDKDGASPTW